MGLLPGTDSGSSPPCGCHCIQTVDTWTPAPGEFLSEMPGEQYYFWKVLLGHIMERVRGMCRSVERGEVLGVEHSYGGSTML